MSDKAYRFMMRMQKLASIIIRRKGFLDNVFDNATQITAQISGEGGGSGINDKVGNAAVKLADLSGALSEYEKEFNRMLKILEKLPNEEYKILYDTYVKCIPMYQYADKVYRSARQCFKLRAKALKDLEELL